eukprot:1138103-Pelagomonas_calceolata.AAC.1
MLLSAQHPVRRGHRRRVQLAIVCLRASCKCRATFLPGPYSCKQWQLRHIIGTHLPIIVVPVLGEGRGHA